MSKIIGIASTTNEKGEISYTLHLCDEFPEYANEIAKGKKAIGQKVETVYAAKYDCSKLKIGDEIIIYYDRAITTSKGTYQCIKKIDLIQSNIHLKGEEK